MQAIVLAGGKGTRLRPYTTVFPKPLVPVGDRPILELIFDWLARHGTDTADVCIGHLGELIQTYFSQAQTIPRLQLSRSCSGAGFDASMSSRFQTLFCGRMSAGVAGAAATSTAAAAAAASRTFRRPVMGRPR